MADYIETPTMGEILNEKFLITPPLGHFWRILKMKKSIIIFLLVLISLNLYSQDITKINLEEYKLDSRITSTLVEETKIQIENKMCDYVMPTAFIKSPYEDRIALIVANAEYVFEGREVFINFYGCNLESGFTNQIK